jgi:hypothetical protein
VVSLVLSNDEAWWAAFGAVSQAVGALATFITAAIALWIAVSDRRRASSVEVRAGLRVLFPGDGSPPTELVGFEIINTGVREIEVSSVGWRCGWFLNLRLFGTRLRFEAPACLRQRFAIQNPDTMQNPPPHPWLISPGRQLGLYTTVALLRDGPAAASRSEFFGRKLPIIGFAPIRMCIHIIGRKPLFAKIPEDLERFLRTGDHGESETV